MNVIGALSSAAAPYVSKLTPVVAAATAIKEVGSAAADAVEAVGDTAGKVVGAVGNAGYAVAVGAAVGAARLGQIVDLFA
jgi:hypothetical protein